LIIVAALLSNVKSLFHIVASDARREHLCVARARRIAMGKLTIILNDPPYGTEKIYNGLRYASALVSAGVQPNLFLLADGVTAARRGQKTPTGYYNVADMLSDLIAKGVKVKT
jgi:DsrE/DsrF-like family